MKIKPQTVKAVKPNLGLELRYRRALLKLVERMNESVQYWLKSAYRQNEPVMAQDAERQFVAKTVWYKGAIIEINGPHTLGSSGKWYFAYIDDTMMRKGPGDGRHWRTIEAAEASAKKAIDDAVEGKEQSKKAQAKERKRVARDGLPATELQKAVRKLARRWQRQVNAGAPALARYYAQAVEDRTSGDLAGILKEAGISIEFTMTPAQRDVLKATVNANVALIRSLPAKYFASVEQIVMESVQTGRDLSVLSKRLQNEFGITKRRAALIARDQNNKATSALQRARQTELGITKAIWHHSHAGKVPRKTHKAADGKVYDVRKGMYDSKEGRYVHPGELINCKCTGESIIPGLD